MTKKLSRRTFLQTTTMATAIPLFTLTGPTVRGQVVGANDRVRLALSGSGSRGSSVANGDFGKIEGVQVVATVDAHLSRANSAADQIEKAYGNSPNIYQDYRKMLEDKSIDAVYIAASNYWHALMTIWGCQAGKDIYVEKPGSYNIFEGAQTVKAAAKYGRLVQLGTQRRSEEGWARTAAAVQSGKYGKLVAAKVYASRPRGPIPVKPNSDPPAGLDWDLWLGPAAKIPYNPNMHPYNWHWFWETGNGEIGNNGVHYFDLCLWAMGERHPDSIISFGARFVKDARNNYKDHAETPTLHFAMYDFGGTPLVFESCNLAGTKELWNPREEAEFVMEEGTIRGNNFISKSGNSERINTEFTRPQPGGPFRNFINAMRDRNTVPLNAPIAKGRYAAAVCHWGNMAYRMGKPTDLKTCREKIGSNPAMQASVDSVLKNLKEIFGESVDVEKTIPWQCSDKLAIDRNNDRFTDNAEANKLLKRVPREPFVVPEEI
jgi:predicted dehydrogenase